MQMHRLKRSFLETGHKHAVVAALYNRNFHQCISVDEGNLACVWDMRVRPASQLLRRQSVPCRARDAVAVGTSVPRARAVSCALARVRVLAYCVRACVGSASWGGGTAGPGRRRGVFFARCQTGALHFRFNLRLDSKLTACCFDSAGRRLVSGSHDGTVKVRPISTPHTHTLTHLHTYTPLCHIYTCCAYQVWNFSSGACLKTLEHAELLSEVTSVIHIEVHCRTGAALKAFPTGMLCVAAIPGLPLGTRCLRDGRGGFLC